MITKRNLIILGLVLSTLILFMVGARSDNFRARTALAPEYVPETSPAVISNSELLYETLDNVQQYGSVRRDITKYRDEAMIFELSDDGPTNRSFVVLGDTVVDNGTIRFEGSYYGSSDVIAVSIKKLANDRIETSITNLKNEGNIDSMLPSNSKRNKFIASLPIETSTYQLLYSTEANLFVITPTVADYKAVEEAEKFLQSQLDDYSVMDITIDYPAYLKD